MRRRSIWGSISSEGRVASFEACVMCIWVSSEGRVARLMLCVLVLLLEDERVIRSVSY